MDYNEAKKLIEKYFLAETSLAEEKALKEYFAGTNVHPTLEVYSTVFTKKEPVVLGVAFDEKILSLIDAEKPVNKPAIVKNLFPGWLKIAAIFILIMAASLLLYNNHNRNTITPPIAQQTVNVDAPQIEDTYTDPEEARLELEKALSLLSSKINRANNVTAQQVSRLEVISKVIPPTN